MSANEAAHHFGLSEKTVRRWIKSGRLKADKSGRAYRVTLSEVAALIGPDTAHDRGPAADTAQTADIGSAPSTTDSRFHNGLKVPQLTQGPRCPVSPNW